MFNVRRISTRRLASGLRFNSIKAASSNVAKGQNQFPMQQPPDNVSFPRFLGYFWLGSLCLVLGATGGYALSYVPVNDKSTLSLKDTKPLEFAPVPVVNETLEKIMKVVGPDNITTSDGELKTHSVDPLAFVPAKAGEKPYCVVFPETAEQVSQIVKICYNARIPVVPYSGGTSIEGHYVPTRQGVSIDVSRMNKVIAVHPDDHDCVVQPGVEWTSLNELLSKDGLMFGPDPAPGAMIGGIVNTNASGTNAVKFGGAKDNVLALKVVLPDGTIIKTKNRSRKWSNGYNLTNLFIGSEGTLGIVVEATLKLHPVPKNEVITLMNFNTIGDAMRTVSDLYKQGIECNALELMDDRQMLAVHEMDNGGDRKWSPNHLLLIKLGGPTPTARNETVESVKSIGKKNSAFNVEVATKEEDREEIWHMRKTLLWNSLNWARKIKPDCKVLPTDVCVPVSKLPDLITTMMSKMDDAGVLVTASGHAGDGNLHLLVIFSPDQEKLAHSLINEISREAIKLDGTVSGEHGIGMSDKRDLLVEELGEDTISTMRNIKFALDPRGIMNPDHIFHIDPKEHRNPFN